MDFFSVFNIRVQARQGTQAQRSAGASPASHGDAAQNGESSGAAVGAFITPQSLVSFTGATGAISVIWATVESFVSLDGVAERGVGFGISLLVGMLIYWMNISDPQAQLSQRDKAIAFVIALMNSMVLFVASFGAQSALKGTLQVAGTAT